MTNPFSGNKLRSQVPAAQPAQPTAGGQSKNPFAGNKLAPSHPNETVSAIFSSLYGPLYTRAMAALTPEEAGGAEASYRFQDLAERKFEEQHPYWSAALTTGGIAARYIPTAMFGGVRGTTALAAAEAAASRPQESVAGLVGELTDSDVMRAVARNPIGRVAVDATVGYGIGKGVGAVGRRVFGKSAEQIAKEEAERVAAEAAAQQAERQAAANAAADKAEQELARRGRPVGQRALPRGPIVTPNPQSVDPFTGRPRLPAPSFPPESPRFRTPTVEATEAKARAELSERQLRESRSLDEAIAARQAREEAEEAARVAALEAEPSRFPRPIEPPAPLPGQVFGPRQEGMRDALERWANIWRGIGDKKKAAELSARINELDRLREPWDALTAEQQRRFIVLNSYHNSRLAQGLVPRPEELGVPGASKLARRMRRMESRAIRQLDAMESWYKMAPGERDRVLRAMEQESLATRMGELETGWQRTVMELLQSPLDEIVILNPKTGREITVASALKKARTHPARFEAESLVRELQEEMDVLFQGKPRRSSTFGSRIGERPTAAAAAEMPPIPKPMAQRMAEREAAQAARGTQAKPSAPQTTTTRIPVDEIPVARVADEQRAAFPQSATAKNQQWLRNRRGGLEFAAARTLAGAGLGGTYGLSQAETPEEAVQYGLAGLFGGAIAGWAAGPLARQAAQSKLVNEALDDIAKVSKRIGRTPGFPGTDRFRSLAGRLEQLGLGSKRGTPPRPAPAMADDVPLNRPTVVQPSEEPLLRRLNLSPEMQDIYGARIAQIAAAAPKQSDEQLLAKAARLLNTKRETLARINPEKMTGAEGLAIASLVRENTEKMAEMAARLATTVDDDARAALTAQLDAMDGQTNALLTNLMAGRSAQGAALRANRVLANLSSDPSFWFLKAQRVKGAEVLSQAEKFHITSLLNKGEPARDELIQYLASLRKTPWYRQIAQLRRAGFLTALTGRVRDFAGTGGNVVATPILKVPGAFADNVAAAITTARMKGMGAGETIRNLPNLMKANAAYRTMLMPDTNELVAMGGGIKTGWKEMLEYLGYDAIRKGDFKTLVEFVRAVEVDPAILKRYDIPGQINIDMFGTSARGQKANALADFYQKYTMRLSGGTDRLFRAAAYNGAMQEQARLVATREGLSGPALQTRVAALLKEPTDEMVANAGMISEYTTFTNDGTMARAISNLIEAAARAGDTAGTALGTRMVGTEIKAGDMIRTGFDIVSPFRRTPANLLTRILEFTPGAGQAIAMKRAANWWGNVSKLALDTKAGAATAEGLTAVRASQRRMVDTFAANATGLGLLGLGAYLYDNGVLTGEAPRTGAEAEQWRTEGRQPNSILVGGVWHPIGQLPPLGSMLTMAATLRQEAEAGTGTQGAAIGALRTALNQPLMTGPREALEALSSQQDARTEGFWQNMAGSFVPGIVASAARAGGVSREPDTAVESVMSRIPGLAEAVPERLNVFGEPMQRPEGMLWMTTPDVREEDVIVNQMSMVGAEVGKLPKWRGESNDQYYFRQQEGGKQLKVDLTNLILSEQYLFATPQEKRDLIEETATASRRGFADFLKREYGIERPDSRRTP